MSIKRHLRIVLAGLVATVSVTAPADVQASDTTQPPTCIQEPNNTFALAADSNPTTPLLKSALSAIQTVKTSLNHAQFDVYQKTTAGSLPTGATVNAQLQIAAVQLKQALSVSISPSQIGLLRDVVQTYIAAAGQFLSVLAFQTPYGITSFKQAQSMVEFSVPMPLWTELNLDQPIGQAEVIGLNTQGVEVSIAPEKIYSILSDAASASDQLQVSGKDNFEATHCVIAEKIVEQYFLQEQIRGVPPTRIALAVAPSTPACLGLPIVEVEAWQRARASEGSETLFRTAVADGTFTADQALPQAMRSFLATHEYTSGEQLTVPDLTELIINPFFYNVGKYGAIKPSLVSADSQKIENWLAQATSAADKAAPYYGPLMTMTQSPLFSTLLQNVTSNCNTHYTQSNNRYMSTENFQKMQNDLRDHLALVEKSLGLQLIDFIKFYVGRLETLDGASAKLALEQMLIYKKYQDARILIGQFYSTAREDSSPPADQVVDALSDSLYELAKVTVEQALAQKPVQDWFNAMVSQFMKLKNTAASEKSPLPDMNFYSASLALALKAESIYSSSTPNNEIPFNPHIMFFTRAPYIQNSLSSINTARFKVILQQSSYPAMRAAWAVVSSHLASDASSSGYPCKAAGHVSKTTKAVGAFVLSAFGISSSKKGLSANDQCVLMHDTADMMGLNPQTAPFQTLQDAMGVLKTKLSGGTLTDEIHQYKTAYVKQLILPDTRFLTLHYTTNQRDDSAPYLFEKIAQANDPSLALKQIDWGLYFIDHNLSQEASAYLVANNMDGLVEFMNDADGLPDLLANQPAIKAFVAAEQANILRTTGIGWSIFNNYVATIKSVFSWYFTYWAVQSALTIPFRSLAVKYSVMRFLPASLAWVDFRVSPVMNKLFLPMAIYSQALLDASIQTGRIVVNNHIHMAAVNELYFSQGVNTKSGTFMTPNGYLNGTSAIQNANDNSKWSMISDGTMLLFMGGALAGIGIYNKGLSEVDANWFRRSVDSTLRRPGFKARQLEAATASGNSQAIKEAEDAIAAIGTNDRATLEGAARALGLGESPTFTVENLDERLSAIEATGDQNRISDAKNAYNQIVALIGSRAEQMAGDDALKIYAESAIGPGETVEELWRIHAKSADIGFGRPMAGGSP